MKARELFDLFIELDYHLTRILEHIDRDIEPTTQEAKLFQIIRDKYIIHISNFQQEISEYFKPFQE